MEKSLRKIIVGSLLFCLWTVLGMGLSPVSAKENRMIEIILDASGSREGKLNIGKSRLEAAKDFPVDFNGGKKIPFTLKEGETFKFEKKS